MKHTPVKRYRPSWVMVEDKKGYYIEYAPLYDTALELLEALENMVSIVQRLDYQANDIHFIAKAREVIVKAKGGIA